MSLIIWLVTSSLVSLCGDGKSILSIKKNNRLIKTTTNNPLSIVLNKDELLFDLKFNLGCIVVKMYLNSEIKTNLW